ncbi:PREDICTED: dirigent protein 2-like [Camelina sativa]|uniref:Dirigent protein n=1 Tax=Camelina sativa TaxID=90675 RepID=A0ABM0Y1V9_CAMSA|nr:PREDICTED: dirigent protein 2-like [Camelina sativa]
MLTRVIFLTAVATSILVVLLLALLSPVPDYDPPGSLFSFSLYVQQTHIPSSTYSSRRSSQRIARPRGRGGGGGALIFRRTLTEGPENNSRIVGKAEGFIIPHEDFANSDFNVIYLTLETPEYTGSVSIRSRDMTHKLEEVMEVVGGTGAFAFARGIAMFAEVDDHEEEAVTTYRVKLLLRFPHTSHLDPL